MSTLTSWLWAFLGPVAALALFGCAATSAKPHPETVAAGNVTPQMRAGSVELKNYQLTDWTAPDDRTLIVNTVDRSIYEGRFAGRCNGLRLADTISFIVPEPQVEKYTGVVLPDGTRCAFKSFTRVPIPGATESQ